jgi:hypothetical protein
LTKNIAAKAACLKDFLDDSSIPLKSFVLRNDLLSRIIEVDPINNNVYSKKYLANSKIRIALIGLYDEICQKKKKIFSPGLFFGYQGKLNCSIISKHVIENVLHYEFSESVSSLSYSVLYKNHLRSVKECFPSIYDLLVAIYPEKKLKPYYFKKHKDVWFDENNKRNDDLVREAIREFIGILTSPQSKYKHKLKDIPKWISYKTFHKNILPYSANLSYMLSRCFKNSPIDAVLFAYPELGLKSYYFSHVKKNYWKGSDGKEHAKEIMKELLDMLTAEDGPYKFTRDEAVKVMKYKTYHKPLLPYGKKLGGMLQAIFENSPSKPFELLDEISSTVCNDVCDNCEQEHKGVCIKNGIKFGSFAHDNNLI